MKNQAFRQRLGFALAGLRSAWREERSFRTHLVFAALVPLLLLLLRPAPLWWALTGVITLLVLAAELFNTALENLADHLHPDIHPRIKTVKDCAAAAVLLLSLAALWVAGLMVWSVLG